MSQPNRANSRPRPPHHVRVYSRVGCHLCDDAVELLTLEGVNPEIIDIDSDPSLVQKWNTCVPVVEIDGKVRFRGRVHPVLLRRLLSAPAS